MVLCSVLFRKKKGCKPHTRTCTRAPSSSSLSLPAPHCATVSFAPCYLVEGVAIALYYTNVNLHLSSFFWILFFLLLDRVCDICKKIIDGRSLILGEKHFHADCFVCKKCEQPLTGWSFFSLPLFFYSSLPSTLFIFLLSAFSLLRIAPRRRICDTSRSSLVVNSLLWSLYVYVSTSLKWVFSPPFSLFFLFLSSFHCPIIRISLPRRR